ncbi:MAG: hypothetical protein HZC14_03095 [Candidatus Niyogibacteria bacterium]|nr:hypothetical protein [Candidatus Niyogibacteria bacterium]
MNEGGEQANCFACVRDLKAEALRQFREAKADAARRGRENFPSGKLFVTKSLPTGKQAALSAVK